MGILSSWRAEGELLLNARSALIAATEGFSSFVFILPSFKASYLHIMPQFKRFEGEIRSRCVIGEGVAIGEGTAAVILSPQPRGDLSYLSSLLHLPYMRTFHNSTAALASVSALLAVALQSGRVGETPGTSRERERALQIWWTPIHPPRLCTPAPMQRSLSDRTGKCITQRAFSKQ